MLLYFAHIISMMAAYLAITLMTIWGMAIIIFEKANGRQFPFRSRGHALRMLRPFYAFLPTMILCAIFALQKNALHHGIDISWEDKPSPRMLLNHLLSAYSLVSYDRWEIWLSRGFSCLFAAIIVYLVLSRNVNFRPNLQNGWTASTSERTSGNWGQISDRSP